MDTAELHDQFLCPICVQVPKKEIYQCLNGHTICDDCVNGLSLCPQCNINFATEPIRNFALEEILDTIEFNCTFKLRGCRKKVTRREISTHYDLCRFGNDWEYLCADLGYRCYHQMKFKFLHHFLEHLREEHYVGQITENMLEIRIPDIKNVNPAEKITWKPILLIMQSNYYLLAVQTYNGNISFTCIQIACDNKLPAYAQFRIKSQKVEAPIVEWTTKPTQQTDWKSALSRPPLLVSLNSIFSAYARTNVLIIEVKISGNITSNIGSEKVVVEHESLRQPKFRDHVYKFWNAAVERSQNGFGYTF